MQDFKSFFLHAISFLGSFYCGKTGSFYLLVAADRAFGLSSGAELGGIAIFMFFVLISWIVGFVLAVFSLAISLGKFNSKSWRFNRYWLAIGLPLVIFLVLLVTS